MSSFPRIAAVSLLSSILLQLGASSPAAAVVVTIGGANYDVTTTNTSYQSSPDLFDTFANMGQMPWWGNDAFASQIAKEVYASLGAAWDGDHGPVFAYGLDASGNNVDGVIQSLSALSVQEDVSVGTAAAKPYATATLAAPAPLPVVGALAAYGWGRKLRRRARGSRHASCL